MVDIEVILGMDWLFPWWDILDCFSNIVSVSIRSIAWVVLHVSDSSTPFGVISFIQARRLVASGILSYLANAYDMNKEVQYSMVYVIYFMFLIF